MSDFHVDVSDVTELARDLLHAGPVVAAGAAVGVRATLAAVAESARGMVEVETGATRDSIGYEVDGLEGEAGPTTWWAHFIENGTVELPPRPFMGPAFDQHTPLFVDGLAEVAGDIL